MDQATDVVASGDGLVEVDAVEARFGLAHVAGCSGIINKTY